MRRRDLPRLKREAGRLLSEGRNPEEISRELGISCPEALSLLEEPGVREDCLTRLAAARLAAYALAVRRSEEMLRSDNAAVQAKAVHEALDRFEPDSGESGRLTLLLDNSPELGEVPRPEED